jgi:hypothetical protein
MAAKRKKTTATEVTARPAAARSKNVQPEVKDPKVEATRGEFAAEPAKPDAARDAGASTSTTSPAATGSLNGDSFEREQRIRERAYHLWKHAGEPDGQHVEHWTLAEKQHKK